MANLANLGMLNGLGKGVSDFGSALREQWLQAAQEQAEAARDERGNKEWERRQGVEQTQAEKNEALRAANNAEVERVRNEYAVSLEGVKHKNEMERDAAKPKNEKDADPNKPEYWRAGDDSFKVVDGITYVLPKGATQWQKVAEPGEAGGSPIDAEEMEFNASEYADKRVDETAKYFSLDKTDFAQYGGSREKAREAFKEEYRRGPQGSAQPSPAAPSQMPPELKAVSDRAQAALQRGVSRELVIRRLKESGATDEDIRKMGL